MSIEVHKVLESLRPNSPYRDVLTVPCVLRIDVVSALIGAMLEHWEEGAPVNVIRSVAAGNLHKCRQKVNIAKQGITRRPRLKIVGIAHNQGALDTRVV